MSILFISPGVLTDAGGIVISIVGGKVVIKHVPGWNPEVMHEVTAAANVLASASRIKDKAIRGEFERLAHSVVERRAPEIEAYLREA
jgi:hypothetical protein